MTATPAAPDDASKEPANLAAAQRRGQWAAYDDGTDDWGDNGCHCDDPWDCDPGCPCDDCQGHT